MWQDVVKQYLKRPAAACDCKILEYLQQLVLDPNSSYSTYDGNGGLSAGASSRLLYDYTPSVRDEILDYLYVYKL